MSNFINTNLDSCKTDIVELAPGQFFKLKLQWHSDISLEARQKLFTNAASYLKEVLRKESHLKAGQITKLTPDGVFDAQQKRLPTNKTDRKTAAFWKKTEAILQKSKVQIPFPNIHKVDLPEDPIHAEDKASAQFENVEGPHYLDGIAYPRKNPLLSESQENYLRRATQEYVEAKGKKYDPKRKSVKESLVGVALSQPKRSHYQLRVQLKGILSKFFGGDKTYSSTEVLAKNGMTLGSISASANIHSDRVNLLRCLESEDGSVDSLAGRVFDLSSAKELGEFAFLSQMNLYRDPLKAHLAQGIEKRGEVYEFRFAIQSLLPMIFRGRFGGEEIRMVQEEIEAYKKLEDLTRKNPLLVRDPADPQKIYPVHFLPLPVAAVQLNSMTRVEKLLPQSISGEYDSRAQSDLADAVLLKTAQEKIESLPDGYEKKLLSDTADFLKQREKLKSWQEIMVRAFLCHLLKVPFVVHCKSCVDRTNVVNALVSGMKQWIRLGKDIPRMDGKYAIFKLPEETIVSDSNETVHPFKELFALNLHKGLKITELARGEKGYRYFRNFRQYPAPVELLPNRYIKVDQSALRKIKIVVLAVFALIPLVLIWPFAFLSSFRTLSLSKISETLFLPFKFLKNANELIPKRILNEDYELIGKRKLLE